MLFVIASWTQTSSLRLYLYCKTDSVTHSFTHSLCRIPGAERAALPVWEGKKLNPLAFWSFEDCFSYLRKHNVPYHPLHDVGFSSLGDMHSTKKVEDKVWFTYGGERSGRFQNLINKDGSAKTECGIHTEISTDLNLKK